MYFCACVRARANVCVDSYVYRIIAYKKKLKKILARLCRDPKIKRLPWLYG